MSWPVSPRYGHVTGQQIPCFDSLQLTITWTSIIKLNTGYTGVSIKIEVASRFE